MKPNEDFIDFYTNGGIYMLSLVLIYLKNNMECKLLGTLILRSETG